MKTTTIIFAIALSLTADCAKNIPAVREPTQSLIGTFPQIESTEPAPLETVTVPGRDEPPQGSTFFRLKLGEVAPINGFLFSDTGAAFITTEYEAISQRYELALNSQRERDFQRLKLMTNTLQLQINTDRAKMILLLQSFDFQIQDLQEIIKEQNSPFHNIVSIIAAGSVGLIVGAIVGIIAVN